MYFPNVGMGVSDHIHMYNNVQPWTGTFFIVSIQEKLNAAYIIEFGQNYMVSKKAWAEECSKFSAFVRRDLSYETDSGPKPKIC